MIHTATQIKALVRNVSHGNSAKAQILLRSYAMERFLVRLAQSAYQENIILKGGALVSAMLGQAHRSTMDMDATVKQRQLSIGDAREIVEDIMGIAIADGMSFDIKSIETIMDEADYSGVRVTMEAVIDAMRIPLKLDFSTGDVITPREVLFAYPLLFENNTIPVSAYNLETLLAEKLETVFARGVANTRMRDFYDIYALDAAYANTIDEKTLGSALISTSESRGSTHQLRSWETLLAEIAVNQELMTLWRRYQKRFDYASNIEWSDIIRTIHSLCNKVL